MSFVRISAFALLVLAVAVLNSAEGKEACLGCFEEISPDDATVKKTLNMALSSVNAGNYKILKITKAERQVVAGFKYRIRFKAEVPGKGILKCRISFIDGVAGKGINVNSMSCKK
uniref:Venom cystatin-like protein 2 n=1 Tax=Pristhesancus plagipennis TaxID=1955184 RepID=A0A1Q1NP93_PRIPG|nr:venom cystatin-like protein 2 [Pristhesancus plagipennis]